MALTDMEIRTAKPGARLIKLSDGGGLQLWITPDGAKRWRLAYRFAGGQKLLAIGVYPSIGLREAREAREEAKRVLSSGQDPSFAKKLAKAAKAVASANTFDAIGAKLLEKKRREGKAEGTIVKFEWFMKIARPAIGARPIAEITAPEILAVLRPIESRGRHESARRLRATIGEVFRYAVAMGPADADPTGALKGALTAPAVQHRAAIIEPRAFGGLLRAIETYDGAPETKAALELLALTFVRPGELRVPLAPRTIAILNDLQKLTGCGKFLFPSVRSASRCMSENTINAALRRMGFTKDEMTGHGFRSAASSMLNESGKWNADAIEAQLAHVENDAVRRAYHRADYWNERVSMMAYWADYLEELRNGVKIIAFRA
jgi:integrase